MTLTPSPVSVLVGVDGWIGLTAAAARKALQDSLREDEVEEEEDEQRYLNLNEEESDVWDDDSAYIEMLAKEVRSAPLERRRKLTVNVSLRDAGPTPA